MNRTSALAGLCTALFAAGYLSSASTAEESGAAGEAAAEAVAGAEGGTDTGLPDSAADKTCVMLRSIDHTDVVDDYNILFYMRGPEIFHVRLPNRCPGLRISDSFMYSTSLNVLCDLDIIRPLRNLGGSFTPGAACGMGRFTPITKEEVALLKNKDVEVEAERGDAEVETQLAGQVDAVSDGEADTK